MIAGTVCRVVGLSKAPELNGHKGTALRLDAKSGRYVVKLDGGAKPRGIKGCNLIPETYVEDAGKDTVVVHGCVYCGPHRLEICGACGMSFRLQNRWAQVGMSAADGYDKAEELDQKEANEGKPPRSAPGRGQPVEPVPTPVRYSSAALAAKHLNPSALPPWDSGEKLAKVFEETFSMQERFASSTGLGHGEVGFAPFVPEIKATGVFASTIVD